MDHSRASELLGAYAMDACNAAETAAVADHLQVCTQCAGDSQRFIDLVAWIGASQPIAPPPGLRARLLHPANGTRPPASAQDLPPTTSVGA